ncbi:metallophosphoesterase [Candidatus Methylomirabilis sp.]|uniref:metallophosphoesterase n=1 Tax=Candidatus Methylomirabilis sp. TaxID=2032687 RepID=UPI002A5FBA32|nr:metallophosphoesterase [Candidatus Methylomirabilis sp.]
MLVASQLYLFVRGDRALQQSRWSLRRKKLLRLALIGFFVSTLIIYIAFLSRWAPLEHPSPLILYLFIYPTAIWSFGSLFSFLLLLLADLTGYCARLIRAKVVQQNEASALPLDPSRRMFMQTSLGALTAAPILVSGYGASYASNGWGIEEVHLSLSSSHPFDPPLKVVQVSDIHSGLFMTPDQMRHYAEAIRQLGPDLFVLTGDFIANSAVDLPPCIKEMARVESRYGSFAVLGNHEHWYGEPEKIITAFEGAGISILHNSHQILEIDRGSIAIAGIDDLRVGRPNLGRALDGLNPTLPTILLSHRPEIFPRAAARNITLTLSGHYHGGQVKVSVLGLSISPAHLLSPYPEGLYRLRNSHLYVNRGLGTTGTPVRVNAPPEITLFHLT